MVLSPRGAFLEVSRLSLAYQTSIFCGLLPRCQVSFLTHDNILVCWLCVQLLAGPLPTCTVVAEASLLVQRQAFPSECFWVWWWWCVSR